MQHEINAALLFVNSDRGFSFDELVLCLQEVLLPQGERAILELMIILGQDKLFKKFLIQNITGRINRASRWSHPNRATCNLDSREI